MAISKHQKKIEKNPNEKTKSIHSSSYGIPLWGWPFIILTLAALLFALVVIVYGMFWVLF